MSIEVSRLADHVLVDSDGEEHRFGDRWSERRSLVLFLRHFG
jgi:hypothetical protein